MPQPTAPWMYIGFGQLSGKSISVWTAVAASSLDGPRTNRCRSNGLAARGRDGGGAPGARARVTVRTGGAMATAGLFVPLHVEHPVWMLLFLVLTAVTFSLLGFIIGIWADGFEKLQLVPLLIVTPLTFLGGTFYSIDMLPPLWQKITLFNPVVYLVSGFRWSFFGIADVAVWISMGMTLVFMAICLAIVAWIFKTGYRLKT